MSYGDKICNFRLPDHNFVFRCVDAEETSWGRSRTNTTCKCRIVNKESVCKKESACNLNDMYVALVFVTNAALSLRMLPSWSSQENKNKEKEKEIEKQLTFKKQIKMSIMKNATFNGSTCCDVIHRFVRRCLPKKENNKNNHNLYKDQNFGSVRIFGCTKWIKKQQQTLVKTK